MLFSSSWIDYSAGIPSTPPESGSHTRESRSRAPHGKSLFARFPPLNRTIGMCGLCFFVFCLLSSVFMGWWLLSEEGRGSVEYSPPELRLCLRVQAPYGYFVMVWEIDMLWQMSLLFGTPRRFRASRWLFRAARCLQEVCRPAPRKG